MKAVPSKKNCSTLALLCSLSMTTELLDLTVVMVVFLNKLLDICYILEVNMCLADHICLLSVKLLVHLGSCSFQVTECHCVYL